MQDAVNQPKKNTTKLFLKQIIMDEDNGLLHARVGA